MGKRRVTILYDRIEDDELARARAAGEDTTELTPVHVPLGEALASRGHEVAKIAAGPDVRALFEAFASDRSEVVFNVCDGIAGEAKKAPHVASLLELLGRPFTGSSAAAMRLVEDKAITKQLFRMNGVATPRYSVVQIGASPEARLPFPVIVKPLNEDASVGITDESVVSDVERLRDQVNVIHQEYRSPALIEEFIPGREIYAAVLGNEGAKVLPLLEWPLSSRDAIGSWEAKWQVQHENYQRRAETFADLPEELVARISRDALRAYRALKLTDYARFDIRLSEDGTPYFLEANANPFIDPSAEVATAAERLGLSYADLVTTILELAIERAGLVKRVAKVARRKSSKKRVG